MNNIEDLQPLVGGSASKEAEIDDMASPNRETVSLTEALKNDSVLGTQKDRRSTGAQRVCRCSQIKILKEKTLEKIRMSMELENERRSTAANDKSKESIKSVGQSYSKEQGYSEIFDNNAISGGSVMSDSKAEGFEPKESSRVSSNLLVETEKPYRISDFPPVRQSIRISSIPDDDIFEDIDKFHEKEQERIQANQSSRESRYTEIFSNDICGFIEPLLIGDQEEQQQTASRRVTVPIENEQELSMRRSTVPISNQEAELQKRSSRRSSKVQRYTEIYGNDMMGCILEVPDDNEEPVRDTNRSSKEQRYSEIYDNDLFGMPVDFRESDEFLNRDQLKLVTLEPVIYVESEEFAKRFSSHHSSLKTAEVPSKKSSLQIPNLDPRLSTNVTRYTEVFDNDMFGRVGFNDKAIQTISVHSSAATIPQTKNDYRRSTIQQRYTEIFDNDMLGGIEQQMNLPGTPSRQSIVTKQSSAVTQNDLPAISSRQSSVAKQPSSKAQQSTATDQQNRISKEQSYSKISNNDLSRFVDEVTTAASKKAAQLAESSSKIKQQDAAENAPTRHSCSQKIKICSDSCTSHLKPHACSLEAPSCSISCTTCKPFTDNSQRSSAQYDADDERSSLLLHGKDLAMPSSSSIKLQQDQTSESSKIHNPKRLCSCSQKYPKLFEKVLSK